MQPFADCPERNLLIAVVLQARDDILALAPEDLDYADAVSFFTAAFGPWQRARSDIADHIALHSDDLTRLGRKAIAASREKHGLPPLSESVSAAQKKRPSGCTEQARSALLHRIATIAPKPPPPPPTPQRVEPERQQTAADRAQMQRFLEAMGKPNAP